jgi:hypothetical protein
MTLAPDPLRAALRRLFLPAPEEKTRRERELLNRVSELAGTVVPWALAGVLGWAMTSLMTGWNLGLF